MTDRKDRQRQRPKAKVTQDKQSQVGVGTAFSLRQADRPINMHTQAQTLMNNSNISKSADNLRGAVGDTGNSVMREVEIFRTGAHPNHRVNGVGIRAKSVRSQQTQVGAANLTEWSPIRIQNYRTQTNTNTPIRS